MPNGYRRGGTYTRNGRTFTRRGTRIAGPSTGVVVAGVAFSAAALLGTGSALTVTVAAVGITALVCYRYRRPIARAWRSVQRSGHRVLVARRKASKARSRAAAWGRDQRALWRESKAQTFKIDGREMGDREAVAWMKAHPPAYARKRGR